MSPPGGAETFSDVPIRFSRNVRKRLLQFPKASKKGPMGILGLTKGLKLADLAPEAPAIANYTTGEVMVRQSSSVCLVRQYSLCFKIPSGRCCYNRNVHPSHHIVPVRYHRATAATAWPLGSACPGTTRTSSPC
jgi:hypothetical protein